MNRLTSIFLLLLFLFPFAEKELHAFEHLDEEHCLEHEKTHLHHKDHVCSIDDFSFFSSEGIILDEERKYYPNDVIFISFYTSEFVSSLLNQSFLRGPPALS